MGTSRGERSCESSTSRRAVVVVAFCAATSSSASATSAPAPPTTKPTATEIGVTPTEIRIAVIADVDTPLAPGAYEGAQDAVIGLGQVHQPARRARRAQGRRRLLRLQARRRRDPQRDHQGLPERLRGRRHRRAVPEQRRRHGRRAPTRRASRPACPTSRSSRIWEAEQNSPVSFPITAPSKVFSDPTGQTYQAQRRPVPLVPADTCRRTCTASSSSGPTSRR